MPRRARHVLPAPRNDVLSGGGDVRLKALVHVRWRNRCAGPLKRNRNRPLRRRLGGHFNDASFHSLQTIHIGISELDEHFRPPGNDARGPRKEPNVAAGPDGSLTGQIPQGRLKPSTEIEQRDAGIRSAAHWSGTRMILLPLESQYASPNPNDRRHHADSESAFLEKGTLLDVGFEIPGMPTRFESGGIGDATQPISAEGVLE